MKRCGNHRGEGPTWLLALTIYGGWLALTWATPSLPWWVVLPLGAWLVAWHGSLQHEALHGHPTRSPRLNAAVAGFPLWLWLPYSLYRDSHLTHHRDAHITDPLDDPESFYVSPSRWRELAAPVRALWWAHQTLVGRMVLGPPWMIGRLAVSEARRLARGDVSHVSAWAWHALGVAGVLGWTTGVCAVPVWQYLLLFVYPGLALSLVRSFAEHRPDPIQARRTVLTEAGPLMGLLFLHNNLHVVHHRHPHLPWYELPARYRVDREQWLEENGSHLFRGGYLEQLRRYAFRPKDTPIHPFAEARDNS